MKPVRSNVAEIQMVTENMWYSFRNVDHTSIPHVHGVPMNPAGDS